MEKSSRRRISMIDCIRGICIAGMVIYHGAYDLIEFFSMNVPFFYSPILSILHVLFVSAFLLIAGISSHFSRNNLKRALFILIAAAVISVVSFIIVPDAPIYFGILHLMGVSVLIYAIFKKPLDAVTKKFTPLFWLALFLIGYFTTPVIVDSPLFVMFGFLPIGFESVDYFPLIPWFFMFMVGTYLGKPITENRFPEWFYHANIPPLSFIGRYPLIIYMVHQPIIYGILFLVEKFI